MPTTRYPARSPIGQAAYGLVQTLMSADKSDVQRQKEQLLAEQVRGRDELSQNLATNYGLNSDHPALGAIVGSAVDAGTPVSQIGDLVRTFSANRYGATDPRTTNAVVGAGGSYSSTAPAFQTDQQNTILRAREASATANAGAMDRLRYETGSKLIPVIGDGGRPALVPQGQYAGQVPLVEDNKVKGGYAGANFGNFGALPAPEQRYLGADGGTGQAPKNYRAPDGSVHITYDGVTDARTQQPLPGGGFIANAQGTAQDVGLPSTVRSKLVDQDIAAQKFRNVIGYARKLITPSNVGAPGIVKGFAQDASQLATGLAQGLNYSGLNEAISDMQRKATANGVDPSTVSGLFNFDPRLPKLETAYDMMVYSGAEALANQSGRSVTDRDIIRFKSLLGDPRSFFANPDQLNAKLDAAEELLGLNQQVNAQAQGQPLAAPAPAQTLPAGAPPSPAGPPAASQPPPEARQAPDGNYYVADPNRPGKYMQWVPDAASTR
jgi:hypothetical protein